RDVNGTADLEPFEIDLEDRRDAVVGAEDLDVVAHDVEHAAALQARRKRVVRKLDRNRDADDAVLADAKEIDVDGVILHGIDLHVAGNDADFLRADGDVEHGRGEVSLDELLPKVVAVNGNDLGGLAVSIDDGG